MSDELTPKPEQSSNNNKNEQQSNSHESQANYAFAQMRKENSELSKRVDELKTANEELKKKVDSFENNKSKESFKAEFKKQGGKDEAFDTFCELNKDLLKEADETAYWLELLIESGIVQENQVHDLYEANIELIVVSKVAGIARLKISFIIFKSNLKSLYVNSR